MADDRRRPRPPSASGRSSARKPADSARRGSGAAKAKGSGSRGAAGKPYGSDRPRGSGDGRQSRSSPATGGERGRPPARRSDGSERRASGSSGRGSTSGREKGSDRPRRAGDDRSSRTTSGKGAGRGRPEGAKRGSRGGPAPKRTWPQKRTDGFGPYHKDDGDEPAPRRRGDDDLPKRAPGRPALRTVGTRGAATEPKPARKSASRAPAKARRRRRSGPADVEQEIARLAGRNSERFFKRLMDAADAYSHDREREALRLLRPLRDQIPDSPSVRELVGLCQYRVGNYNAAVKELEAYAELSDSVDQNPVLMDCYRAQRRWRKVESAWEDLAAVSPSGDVVAEGRIVYAGALADQGRIDDALALLRKRAEPVRDPKEYHLRLWYALADLEERAGNLARARELFDRVRQVDPQYVDVAERCAALG